MVPALMFVILTGYSIHRVGREVDGDARGVWLWLCVRRPPWILIHGNGPLTRQRQRRVGRLRGHRWSGDHCSKSDDAGAERRRVHGLNPARIHLTR